jgi:uncharacterized protein YvpB
MVQAISVRNKRISASLLALAIASSSILIQPAQARAGHDAVIIEGIPSVIQWYSLSCEYAAAAAITLYWGNLVSQSDFIAEIPQHPNPHVGYRGNIHGPHGWIDDYGIYAEPLVPVLEKRGYNAEVFYGGVERLKAHIDAGHPVVAWLTTMRWTPRPEFWETFEGETFKLVPAEHAIVVYGYDSDGVYSMDVSNGGFFHTEWESFLFRWNYFGGMSLAIYP